MIFEAERERGCRSKRRYDTAAEAQAQVDFSATYDSTVPELHVYACRFCRGFHLTSRPRTNEQNADRSL